MPTRDNDVLLDTPEKLHTKGNALVVVEHGEDTIRRAAHLLDLGPEGGDTGGRVAAQATLAMRVCWLDSSPSVARADLKSSELLSTKSREFADPPLRFQNGLNIGVCAMRHLCG